MSRQDLLSTLKQIDLDLDRIDMAWCLFEASTKEFADDQSEFVRLLNASGVGGTFDFIQMVLMHDGASAVCRITDRPRRDRITLDAAVELADKMYSSSHPGEMTSIVANMNALRMSRELSAIRDFRNMYIGHTLRGPDVTAQYSFLPQIAQQIAGVVEELYTVCGSVRWKGQTSTITKLDLSRRFWGYLESGMLSRTAI